MAEVDLAEELTQRQQGKIHDPSERWSSEFAARVVRRDFEQAQSYRQQNHDWRWRNADDLYVAYVPQKLWEGTRIPRSSLGVFLAYQQIESMLPQIMAALFGNDPWFEAVAMGNTPPAAATTVREVLLGQAEEACVRECVRRAVKSGLTYGNGILSLDWEHSEMEKEAFIPFFVPKRRSVQDINGNRIQIPTGEFDRRIRKRMVKDVVNRPRIRNVPIKDFYIDPNCPGPTVKEARFCIQRHLMAADELKALRDTDGFQIPDDVILKMLVENRPVREADNTKGFTETARQGAYEPQTDFTADLGGKRIEVLRYWTNERLVWLASGIQHYVLYNRPNPYGFIPYYNTFYSDMMDRFYGLAVTDVVEGEQRFQQALLNARIDELSLAIHPPTVRSSSVQVPPHQLRMRPGALIDAEDPTKDIVRQFPQNVTQQAFMEGAASDQRTGRITGQSDLTVAGNPGAGSNPRSALEAGARVRASSARIQYFIENIETNVLEELLQDQHQLNRRFLDPAQMIGASDGREIDPIQVFSADIRVKMRAASRLSSRQGLLQSFPVLMQLAMNPMLAQELRVQGKTIDWPELLNIFEEMSGYKHRIDLIRDMTEQEMQMAQQQQPSPEDIKLQLQRERMQDLQRLSAQEFEQDTTREVVREASKAMFEKEEPSGDPLALIG